MRLHVEHCRIYSLSFYSDGVRERETSQTKPNSDLKSQNNNSFMRCYLFRISSICSNALCVPICFSKLHIFHLALQDGARLSGARERVKEFHSLCVLHFPNLLLSFLIPIPFGQFVVLGWFFVLWIFEFVRVLVWLFLRSPKCNWICKLSLVDGESERLQCILSIFGMHTRKQLPWFSRNRIKRHFPIRKSKANTNTVNNFQLT